VLDHGMAVLRSNQAWFEQSWKGKEQRWGLPSIIIIEEPTKYRTPPPLPPPAALH